MRKSKRKASKRKASKRKTSKRKKNSKRKASVRPDRLSELPDSLILQILSLLETRDAVRTSLLSKRWKELWTTVPCLGFRNASNSNFSNSVAFTNFVSRALSLWKGSKILKFSLCSKFDKSFSSDTIDLWLYFAMRKQVEELNLFLYSRRGREYCLPQRLYSCSSITKLYISFCKLKIEVNVNVQWNQLKSLTILSMDFLSEDVVNHILGGAPRLEKLNLKFSESSENLNIQSGSLKMLYILNGPCVVRVPGADKAILRIGAPNLEVLNIIGSPYARCLLKVPSLTNAVLGFEDFQRSFPVPDRIKLFEEMLRQDLASILHVEVISLSYWCCKVIFEMKKDMLVQFPNAKFLTLRASTADEILGFLEMFPELTTLTLKHKDICLVEPPMSLEPNMAKVDSETKTVLLSPSVPHLRKVEITWFLHDIITIISAIQIVLEHAQLLEKMVLRPRSVDGNQQLLSSVEEKLLSMPRTSPTAKVIVSIEDSD